MTSIRLTRVECQELLDHYRRAADAGVRLRAHILLLLADGHPWATIRAILFCSFGTISQGRPGSRPEAWTPSTAGRVVVDEVVADKGFDGDPQRHACLDRDVFLNIPNKASRVNRRPFDRAVYRGRNRVERLIGKAKQFRRAASHQT